MNKTNDNNSIMLIDGLFTTAHIHRDRLLATIHYLQKKVPLTSDAVTHFRMDDFLYWEMFISRFSKLQDLLGAKVFKAVLDYAEQSTDTMTLIDRLNALEKLGVIDDPHEWKEMRDMRNHLSHDYPDAPELTAANLNHAFNMAPKLLQTLERLEKFMTDLKHRS